MHLIHCFMLCCTVLKSQPSHTLYQTPLRRKGRLSLIQNQGGPTASLLWLKGCPTTSHSLVYMQKSAACFSEKVEHAHYNTYLSILVFLLPILFSVLSSISLEKQTILQTHLSQWEVSRCSDEDKQTVWDLLAIMTILDIHGPQ